MTAPGSEKYIFYQQKRIKEIKRSKWLYFASNVFDTYLIPGEFDFLDISKRPFDNPRKFEMSVFAHSARKTETSQKSIMEKEWETNCIYLHRQQNLNEWKDTSIDPKEGIQTSPIQNSRWEIWLSEESCSLEKSISYLC